MRSLGRKLAVGAQKTTEKEKMICFDQYRIEPDLIFYGWLAGLTLTRRPGIWGASPCTAFPRGGGVDTTPWAHPTPGFKLYIRCGQPQVVNSVHCDRRRVGEHATETLSRILLLSVDRKGLG